MRCLNCGNEISPGETFCGQCGTPNIPQVQPSEMVNSPSAPIGQQSNGYYPSIPATFHAYDSEARPPSSPSHTYYGGSSSIPSGPLYPSPPIEGPSGPQQQTGFYRDATEAMSSLPVNNRQNFQVGFARQSQIFMGMPAPGGFQGANQYNPQMQPFQVSSYAGPAASRSPSQPLSGGQGRGQPAPPQPPRKDINTILIIACSCLALAVISAAALGVLYFAHNNSSKGQNKTAFRPTASVTTIKTPVPDPTAASTPSPTPSPSPSVSPTPSVDPNFTQCSTECASNGFIVEYPNGWTEGPSQDPNGFAGEQFSASSTNNPALMDEVANFKSAATTAHSPEDLLAADLNSQFANQQNYTAPTSALNAWIDGAKWLNESASYQLNNQVEHVEAFAIVYQQRSYIIELQAPDSLFNQINTQYFEMMLGRFQFQQSAP